MIITVYDTETNSLDTAEGFIQEIAWATYQVSFLSEWRLLSSNSRILNWKKDYEVDQEAYKLTGLDREFCKKYGENPYIVFHDFCIAMKNSNFLAGQNSMMFDSIIVDRNMIRAYNEEEPKHLHSELVGELLTERIPHIDSYYDIHGDIKPKSLKYFALDHGYVLNNAHSAIHDVFACAHILSKYPIDDLVKSAESPLVDVRIVCEYQQQALKEKLYENGFRWLPGERRYKRIARRHIIDPILKSLKIDSKFVIQDEIFDGSSPLKS